MDDAKMNYMDRCGIRLDFGARDLAGHDVNPAEIGVLPCNHPLDPRLALDMKN